MLNVYISIIFSLMKVKIVIYDNIMKIQENSDISGKNKK
tara:strand:- start:2452 stop:2568 length:117 start_codon:yes stop_codon:yes gene_type:complete